MYVYIHVYDTYTLLIQDNIRPCPVWHCIIPVNERSKREYRDGIKGRETRPGWMDACCHCDDV